MFLDLGVENRHEVLDLGVQIGDMTHPDIAIALDITTVMDTAVDQVEIKLGKGIILNIMDAGVIGHKAFAGIICMTLCVPTCYIHSYRLIIIVKFMFKLLKRL